MTYNGWKNWDTWNSYNWLSSDYDMTKVVEREIEISGKEDAYQEVVERIMKPYVLNIPDDIDFYEVDFDELYEAFTE